MPCEDAGGKSHVSHVLFDTKRTELKSFRDSWRSLAGLVARPHAALDGARARLHLFRRTPQGLLPRDSRARGTQAKDCAQFFSRAVALACFVPVFAVVRASPGQCDRYLLSLVLNVITKTR